ncbi:MAG TPA: 30S ribosomal protein S6 [Alphaproteobacteria bacterium]|jgi:small subunit ribosomal protein S6|nr:30S ribosomal protein S6 [Alphaproteobacteria bacterium]
MRLYESVFIARQDISTTQVESMADEFAGIITNAGGKVHKREYWGLRSLAYRIKKNRKGHYIMFNLETDGPTLKEYERIMGLNEDVLRFLNIRIEEVEEAPSIIMQNKGERSERGDRDRGDRGDRGPRGPRPDQSDRGGDRSASEAKADAPKAGEDAPAEAAASDDKGSAESAASEE